MSAGWYWGATVSTAEILLLREEESWEEKARRKGRLVLDDEPLLDLFPLIPEGLLEEVPLTLNILFLRGLTGHVKVERWIFGI